MRALGAPAWHSVSVPFGSGRHQWQPRSTLRTRPSPSWIARQRVALIERLNAGPSSNRPMTTTRLAITVCVGTSIADNVSPRPYGCHVCTRLRRHSSMSSTVKPKTEMRAIPIVIRQETSTIGCRLHPLATYSPIAHAPMITAQTIICLAHFWNIVPSVPAISSPVALVPPLPHTERNDTTYHETIVLSK